MPQDFCRKRSRGRAGAGKIGVTSEDGPEIQQRLNAGNSGGASREIGNEAARFGGGVGGILRSWRIEMFFHA